MLLFFAGVLLCSLLSAAALPRAGKGWLIVSNPPHPFKVTGLVCPWWQDQSLDLCGVSFFLGENIESLGKCFHLWLRLSCLDPTWTWCSPCLEHDLV